MENLDHGYICVCAHDVTIDRFYCGQLVRCPMCRNFHVVPVERGKMASYLSFDLQTSRLRLRLALPKDWREVNAIQADPRNYVYEISEPSQPAATKKYLKESKFPRGFAKSSNLVFLISNESGKVLGVISVTFTIPYYSAVLGFMLAYDDQGQGFGTEAVGEVSRFLMMELGVRKLQVMCDSKNHACCSLLEKVGFHQEGMVRKFFHHPERGWLDSPLYAMFRED